MHNAGIISSLDVLDRLVHDASWLAFDFETGGVDYVRDTPLGFAICTDRGVGYVPLVPFRTEGDPIKRPPLSSLQLASVLHLPFATLPVLGWAIKFDMHFAQRVFGFVPSFPVDVQTGYWLLNEEGELALKSVGSVLFSTQLPDFKDLLGQAQDLLREELLDEREAWVQGKKAEGWKIGDARKVVAAEIETRRATPSDIPIDWLAPYCIRDAWLTAFIWHYVVRPGLESEAMLDYFYAYECPFTGVLFDMEHVGIPLDEAALSAQDQALAMKQATIEAAIRDIVGHELNLASHPQLSRYIFEEKGYAPTGRKTKAKSDALDEAAFTLLRLAYPDDDFLPLVVEYKDVAKRRSTYCVGLSKQVFDGRVHGVFKQSGTVTGRLASAEPNLQNIPKDDAMRSVFVASPGHTLISADYSQAELRILAHRSRDKALVEVYRQGGDLHNETKVKMNAPDRRIAKTLNFGVAYGIGTRSYKDQLFFKCGLTREWKDCEQDIKDYYNVYKGINPWKQRVWDEARERGYVETRLGRRRRVDLDCEDYGLRSYREREAVNFLIQGDVADIVKEAMIRLAPQLPQYGAKLLLQVHDELVTEQPTGSTLEVARLVKDTMVGVVKHLAVPFLADVEAGPNWGNTKEVE